MTLLEKYTTITTSSFNKTTLNYNVTHHITTICPPVHACPRRLSPEKWKTAKMEFDQMLELGIIRPSQSDWASALHMVPKKSGSWRPCGDYRSLNVIFRSQSLSPSAFTWCDIPNTRKNIFSKIDVIRAYHENLVEPSDIPKTAITTPFGLFEFFRVPFCFRNAAQTF